MLLGILFLVPATHAKLVIRKPSNSAEAQMKTQGASLAHRNFISFLKCSEQNQDQWEKCAKPLFSKSISQPMLQRYTEMLNLSSSYSEPFYCDAKTASLIQTLEESKYDLYLCFESSESSERNLKLGIVFFRLEEQAPKISKLKLRL
jgi:hypothetical protein